MYKQILTHAGVRRALVRFKDHATLSTLLRPEGMCHAQIIPGNARDFAPASERRELPGETYTPNLGRRPLTAAELQRPLRSHDLKRVRRTSPAADSTVESKQPDRQAKRGDRERASEHQESERGGTAYEVSREGK